MHFTIARLFLVVLLVAVGLAISKHLATIPAMLSTYVAGAIAILLLAKNNRWNIFLVSFGCSVFLLLLVNELLCWIYSVEHRGPTLFSRRFDAAYPYIITFGFLSGMLEAMIVSSRKSVRPKTIAEETNCPQKSGENRMSDIRRHT